MTNPILLTISAILLTLFGEAPIEIWFGLIEDLIINFIGL
jgi:hypothetical protein